MPPRPRPTGWKTMPPPHHGLRSFVTEVLAMSGVPYVGSLFRLVGLVGLLFVLAACETNLPPERTLEVTVTAEGYEPQRLEAQVGEMVTIRLRNRDTVGQNLYLDLPSGTRIIAADTGVDALMSFPARHVGTFRFYTAVPGRTGEGILVITEAGAQ
ncbi:MAG: cupredoxin domain-containing protein [Candidatus Viridilinea halotolerans]|uniref:Cupredoxin domain-containing protein n=1 Tax=Candidatus Viridilinea halotolerans TaxID=2491704 RepID=A0A426TWF2_9CHLR|nr:MAG: cupredoxin domain-containing protein [Candidatus Viridilinea halotolerans]